MNKFSDRAIRNVAEMAHAAHRVGAPACHYLDLTPPNGWYDYEQRRERWDVFDSVYASEYILAGGKL